MTQPKALLFDLGGVMIDIDFYRAFRVWEPISALSYERISTDYKVDMPYQQHERGEISITQYYEHLAQCLQLQDSPEQIAAGWNAIFVDEIAETRQMVQSVNHLLPCYAFSNTNAAHQTYWSQRFPLVVDCFKQIFSSHLMGLRKPERASFDYVAQRIGFAPGDILFFDDLLENIQGAQAAGFQAVHVQSPDDVRTALSRLSLIPATSGV